MRLIDADKLIYSEYTNMFDEQIVFDTVTKARVDSMPTIEAIPIEWIKKEIGCSMEVVRDGDYDYTYASCILQLLERWEKENEI